MIDKYILKFKDLYETNQIADILSNKNKRNITVFESTIAREIIYKNVDIYDYGEYFNIYIDTLIKADDVEKLEKAQQILHSFLKNISFEEFDMETQGNGIKVIKLKKVPHKYIDSIIKIVGEFLL